MNFDDLLKQAKERDSLTSVKSATAPTPKTTVKSALIDLMKTPERSISKAGEERAESALLRSQKTPQTLAEEKKTMQVLPRAIGAGLAKAPLNIVKAVPALAAATLASGGTSKAYEEANKYTAKPVSAEQIAQAQRIASVVPKISYPGTKLDEFIANTEKQIQELQTPGNKILAQAAMAGGQMAPVIAGGGLLGAGVGYGTLGAQAYGQSFGQAIEQGADVKTAGQYAALSSALELATETLVGGIPGLGKGLLSKIIQTPSAVNLASRIGAKSASNVFAKTASAVGKTLSSKGGKLLVNAFGEGIEEVIAEYLAPSIERSTIDPNATDATISELAESFAVGGLLSALLGVPSITLSTGKTVTKLDDVDTLTATETKEFEDELYRLARESNIRKGKITPEGEPIEAMSATDFANMYGLPTPAPKRFNPKTIPLYSGGGLIGNEAYTRAKTIYDNQIKDLTEYIKNYTPKGTTTYYIDENGLSVDPTRDITGNLRRVVVSNNDTWYSDFWKQNNRKPTKGEAKEIAQKIIDDTLKFETDDGFAYNPELIDLIRNIYSEANGTALDILNRAESDSRTFQRGEPAFWGDVEPVKPLRRIKTKEPIPQRIIERPFTVTPAELATTQTIPQQTLTPQPTFEAVNRHVQARTAESGTLPLVDDFAVSQKISRNAVMAQNIKDTAPIKEKLQSIASLVERKFTDTGEAIDKIGKITGDKSLYTYYNNARLSKQRASALIGGEQTDINGDTVGKSLKDIIDPIMEKGEAYYNDFQEYMFNLHNIDRMAQGKPVLEISTGDSAKIAQQLLAKHPEFETLKNEVRGYLDNLINWRVESGLWSLEQAEELKQKYPNYVPSYRKLDSNLIENAYHGGETVKKGLKTAVGSGKQLLPLHEQIAQQTFETVEAATKNRFALKLLQNTNDETRRYVSEIADPDVKNAFTFFKEGEKTSLAVGKDVLEGIEALKGKSKNELEIGMEKVNSKFKELITGWNPFFLVRNAARDLPDAGLYTKNLRAFAKAYPVAAKEILENGPLVRKYKALGGSGNSFFDYAKSTKKPNWLKQNTVSRIEALNEAMEMLPRLTEFIATLSRVDGEITYDDLMEAMYNAAEITVNFGRSGSWGKTLNATFVPFFNPAIQGTSKLIRKFQETKGVEQWTLLVLKAALLGVAPSLLNAMVYDDDEDYKLLDNRVKDTNFLFKIGDDEFIKIPKGRVLSLFGAAAERTVRAVRGEEDAFAGLLTTAKEQVAPISPFESNIVSPIIKTMRNETWYGGTIEPERLQNVRPSERYTEKTTSLSKAIISKVDKIADAINLSPMKLDVLIDSYSGIIGDIAIPLLTPRAEQNILKRSFVVDSATQNRISNDFYTAKQELTYKRNSNEGTMADDVANSYINVVTQKVYDNFAEIRKIENGIWTDKEKREKTRKYYQIINGLELEALSNLKKVTQTASKLSKTIKDYEELKRETNKEVFGAEYALSAYDPKVYQKAEGLNKSGIKYDTFYDIYFSIKDIKADKDSSGNSIAYTASLKKKQAVDKLMKNYTEPQRRVVYKAFDISEKTW